MEKVLYHPMVSYYALRHLATGQLPCALSPDIVISWECHFLQTCRLATCRWKMAPRIGGFMISVTRVTIRSFGWVRDFTGRGILVGSGND